MFISCSFCVQIFDQNWRQHIVLKQFSDRSISHTTFEHEAGKRLTLRQALNMSKERHNASADRSVELRLLSVYLRSNAPVMRPAMGTRPHYI